MALPTFGPFVEVSYDGIKYVYREKFKQSKPIDRPLAYNARYAIEVRTKGNPQVNAAYLGGYDWINTGTVNWDSLVGKARERLSAKVSNRASMGANLATISQSVSMMQSRALQLLQAVRAIRKGDFSTANLRLNLATTPKKVSVKKRLASNWLEYSYGWSPLISDIYNAADVLQSPINDVYVRTTASDGFSMREIELTPPWQGQNPVAMYPLPYEWDQHSKLSLNCRVAMGMAVAVDNPNLWLANQMGLINPLPVLWEVIPWSFVLDWFTNASQFMQLGTEYYGLTLKNEWTTYSVKGELDYADRFLYQWMEGSPPSLLKGGRDPAWKGRVFQMARSPGLASPGFYVRPFKGMSWQRGANAISLLVQQLKR